jgi:hypothetical protein
MISLIASCIIIGAFYLKFSKVILELKRDFQEQTQNSKKFIQNLENRLNEYDVLFNKVYTLLKII